MAAIDDIDLGFDSLFRELSKADGMAVETGLFDPEQATIGMFQEFGTRDIPSRPWLSVAADTAVPTIEKVTAAEMRAFKPNQSMMPVLGELGATMAEHTRAVIRDGKVGGPPLKPETVERKGNSQKLLDSLEMYGSIDYQVKPEGQP